MKDIIYTAPFVIFFIGIAVLGVSTLIYNIKKLNSKKPFNT